MGLGFLVVGLVNVANDLSVSTPSGIKVGYYHTNVGIRKSVGIPYGSRLKHTHVVGATGTGICRWITGVMIL